MDNIAAALLSALIIAPASYAADRPAQWAEKIQLEGVGNLHRVAPNLYRSEQPTKAGMLKLKELGIKTVINLRALHSDSDKLQGTGLLEKRLKIKTWAVQDEHVIEVLRTLRDKEKGPFLIHCQHGADRTGLMTAMYRIVEQGWTKEAALKEMTEGGFGYHTMWKNIRRYVEKVDLTRIRDAVNEASAGSKTD